MHRVQAHVHRDVVSLFFIHAPQILYTFTCKVLEELEKLFYLPRVVAAKKLGIQPAELKVHI